MMRLIEFKKMQDLWFAILPEYIEQGGDFNDCLMVDGAPEMLDRLSNSTDEITLLLSTEEIPSDCVLSKYDEEMDWGYYLCKFPNDKKGKHVALCPVNSFVWVGKHPNKIYIRIKS